MNKLCVAIDVDDTLINLSGLWVPTINNTYETNVKPSDVTSWDICSYFPSLTIDQVFGVLDNPGFWSNIRPLSDAETFINRVLNDGHEFKIVTSTHWKNLTQKFERFFEIFPQLQWKQVVIRTNKQSESCDVLIDDYQNNLIGGSYLKILRSRYHNRSFDCSGTDIHRVERLNEAYEIIRELANKKTQWGDKIIDYSHE